MILFKFLLKVEKYFNFSIQKSKFMILNCPAINCEKEIQKQQFIFGFLHGYLIEIIFLKDNIKKQKHQA